MKQFIYTSKFPASPEATKRQQVHFETDVAFANSEGYAFIKSSDDMTFQITDPDTLVEVDVTEEDLQNLQTNLDYLEEDLDKLINEVPEEEDYCIECHNLMLIDQVINNTLLQEGKLSKATCSNLLKLGQLKSILGGH